MKYEPGAQDPDAMNIGVPKGTAKELHLQHHYITRERVLAVIMESQNRINVTKLEALVLFHASQIPDLKQYVAVCQLLEEKRHQYLDEILDIKKKKDASNEDYERATYKACVDAEETIQLIMDDDLAIRETTTVGF